MAEVEVELLPSHLATVNEENEINNNLNDKLPIRKSKWNIEISDFAKLTHNPIRAVVEGMKIEPNPEKQMIALSIGELFVNIFTSIFSGICIFCAVNMLI